MIPLLLQLAYRLLYHQFAGLYDRVADLVSLGRWQAWVRAVLPFLESGPLLELGFGPGHLQEELVRRGLTACGLEESRAMVHLAGSRLHRSGAEARLVRGRAETLPFRTASFRFVVATFPSDYIFDPACLEEVCRVLVPGGELLVLMTAWITGPSTPERLARLLLRRALAPDPEALRGAVETRLQGHDLQVRSEILTLPGSRLLLVRAVRAS